MEVIGRRWTQIAVASLGLAFVATLAIAPARAEEGHSRAAPNDVGEGSPKHSAMPEIDVVARALAEMITPRWEGPRVPWPEVEPRPMATEHRRSRFRPLAVHGREDDTIRLGPALEALELAYDGLRARGYEPPYPDGGRGGDARFDLYLTEEPWEARGAADTSVAYAALDGVSSFARVDPSVPKDRFVACVVEAYAEAILLGLDPAESPALRRATAAFLTHQVTGRFGCGEGVYDVQRAPSGSPLFDAAGEGEGGALALYWLSARHDGGKGAFVHALWEIVRQKTWDTGDLRALPDLERAIERSLERAGHDLRSTMIDFAAARLSFGRESPKASGLAELENVPPIEPEWHLALEDLPAHTAPPVEAMSRFGSGYAVVDVRGAPAASRLRVWLRGELGVDWSLAAMTLDAQGDERGRVVAPLGPDPRRSYLAVELTPEVERVIVIVTNLGPSAAIGKAGKATDRRFRLIVATASEQKPGERADATPASAVP
jgi:hypothetical protein